MSLNLRCSRVFDWLTRNPPAWIFISTVLHSFLTAKRKVNFAWGAVTAASLHVEMWGFYSSPHNNFTKEQARGRWWPMGRERRVRAILMCSLQTLRSEERKGLIGFEQQNRFRPGYKWFQLPSLHRHIFVILETQLEHFFMLLGGVISGDVPAAFDICMAEQLKSAVLGCSTGASSNKSLLLFTCWLADDLEYSLPSLVLVLFL